MQKVEWLEDVVKLSQDDVTDPYWTTLTSSTAINDLSCHSGPRMVTDLASLDDHTVWPVRYLLRPGRSPA